MQTQAKCQASHRGKFMGMKLFSLTKLNCDQSHHICGSRIQNIWNTETVVYTMTPFHNFPRDTEEIYETSRQDNPSAEIQS